MPNARRRIRRPTLIGIGAATICVLTILTVIVVAWDIFTGGEARAGRIQTAQDGKSPVPVPVLPENEADAPLVITEASAEVGEPYETILKGMRGDNQEVTLIDKGEKARRIKFTIKMVNQSDNNITQFHARILNPSFLADDTIVVDTSIFFLKSRQRITIKPQESFTFTTDLPVSERRNGQELVSHLSDFRVKIAEVSFEPGTAKEWIEGGKFSNLFGRLDDMVWVTDCQDHQTFRMVKKRPVPDTPAPASGQTVVARLMLMPSASCPPQDGDGLARGVPPPMRVVSAGEATKDDPFQGVMRPTLLYKEKAGYTPEALDKKIQGTVILDVLYSVDGTVTDIKVVRGLPHGLTQKAIEAARRVRFQPATKNGAPVSVRGPLRFDFNLY